MGHSLIFLSYERDETGNVTGMNIADQGYQSGEVLTQSSWAVWFGANLTVEAPVPEVDGTNVIPGDSLNIPQIDSLISPSDTTENGN